MKKDILNIIRIALTMLIIMGTFLVWWSNFNIQIKEKASKSNLDTNRKAISLLQYKVEENKGSIDQMIEKINNILIVQQKFNIVSLQYKSSKQDIETLKRISDLNSVRLNNLLKVLYNYAQTKIVNRQMNIIKSDLDHIQTQLFLQYKDIYLLKGQMGVLTLKEKK